MLIVNNGLSRRAWFGVAGASVAAAALSACGSSTQTASTTTVTVPASPTFATESPRANISDADMALTELKQGNLRFVESRMMHPDQNPDARLALSKAQSPYAIVLSCSDSRLPPEVVFDQGLGDLFVVRVAGNIVDPAGMGSIEYAVGHLGSPLIVVLAHQNCGAVSATLESLQTHTLPHGDIEALVTAITPAVAIAEKNSGPDLLTSAIKANADQSRDQILQSKELKPALDAGKLKVVTGYYSLDDGTVTFS
ncbi:carbonic anhydrase [Mycolicibacterium anyangense]|uniref:carbonic anhydrase n=1 Tax=Mycolicibacterium anyangense TaxID=1431246 RepID=A0A6N4WAI0_9MYCO|nr:carbonic anhydrase [Mycolicibacterium anyangense]